MEREELKWSLIEECIKRGLDDGIEDIVQRLKEAHDKTEDRAKRNAITQTIYWLVAAHLHVPNSEEE